MIGNQIENVRVKNPIIHNITNYVTANDVANILLACGASPIMSDEPADIAEITAPCSGLHINMGTLHVRSVAGMLRAGKTANALGHETLLDPVGVGASSLRRETAMTLLKQIRFDAVRGNVSEMKALAAGGGTTHGVDADVSDRVTEENLPMMIAFAKRAAAHLGSIVAMTGVFDLVADADRCYVIYNGRPEMSRVTGTGCQLSGLMTAFLAANPQNRLEAAAAAVCAMGLAGEIAFDRMQEGDGNATYRNRIIDAVSNMTADILERGAKYELF